jgi:hypothetical protein
MISNRSPGRKKTLNSFQHMIFGRGLFLFGRDCEQREQEVFVYGTSCKPQEKSSHGGNCTDWFFMSTHGFIDPISFNETVNSDRYLHTLQNDFLPQLRAKGLHQQTQQYIQDGASTVTENCLSYLLNTILILYLQ